jgi:hypothetical protein
MAEAIDRSRTCNLSVNIRSNRDPHCVAFLKGVSRENRGRYFSFHNEVSVSLTAAH